MEVLENVKQESEEAASMESPIKARIPLDFDMLQQWCDKENNDFPICSFLTIYRASGVQEVIASLRGKETGLPDKLVPLDNLACNFYTLQRMRNLIQHNWSYYALDIDGDNHVFWDPKRPNHKRAAKKKIKSKIYASINLDCINFCPGVDDELEDNVLVIRETPSVPDVPEEEKDEVVDEVVNDGELSTIIDSEKG